MESEIALVTAETSAVLLTILFIAIQYLSRQLSREDVPVSTIETAANVVSYTALILIGSAFFSTWYLDIHSNGVLVTVILSSLLSAFITIGLGIREVAVQIRTLANDADKSNRRDVQSRIEEYHR